MKTTKRFKLLMGSASALLGGVLLASAAAVTQVANYDLTVDLASSNSTQPIIVGVSGIPTPASTDISPGDFGTILTDGAGKLDGVWDLSVSNLTDTAPYTSGIFIADVNGQVKSAGKTPVPAVSMNVKGNGYLQDGTGTALSPATISFTFNGKLVAMSSFVPTPLGTNVTIVTTNANGTVSTNFEGPFTTNTTTIVEYTNVPAGSALSFVINNSFNISTNAGGTNTVQHNNAFIDAGDQTGFPHDFTFISPGCEPNYNFGPPVASNVLCSVLFNYTNGTGSNAVVVSNTYNWYIIGTQIDYTVTTFNGTSTTNLFPTNTVSGLADTNIAGFISDYMATVGISNASEVQLVISIMTNTQVAASGTFSNTSVTIPNVFSNAWYEVDGTLKGSINGSKVKHSLNNEAATLLAGSHFVYFPTGTDSNGVVVFRQSVAGENNAFFENVDYIDSKVVTANNGLWMSAFMYDTASFSGKGTLNSKKSTYTSTLRGVARSRGSSAKLTGSTGLITTGNGTNVATLTNIAAIPNVSINYTNTTMFTVTPFLVNNVTNLVSGTNEIDAHNQWQLPIAGATNTIPNGITTVTASGKISGQQFGPIFGVNPAAVNP